MKWTILLSATCTHKQDSIWLLSCWNFHLLYLRSSTWYQFKFVYIETFTHHRSKTCPFHTIIQHKIKEIPAFPSGASQKLTNLAPNIPSTRLPMHKFGTCARVVRRGYIWCDLDSRNRRSISVIIYNMYRKYRNSLCVKRTKNGISVVPIRRCSSYKYPRVVNEVTVLN